MKFLSLTINRGIFSRTFEFAHTTLIHSINNSVGKTTLLRILLYSLGYPIPQTKGLNFSEYEYTLKILTDSAKEIELFRRRDYLSIKDAAGDVIGYSLPIDLNHILSSVFEIPNQDVLDNLLGCFYLDQEKGWTLLNRGKVIGNVPFSIEKLVLGLSSRSCDDLYAELKSVDTELKKYEYMFSTAKYKSQLNDYNGDMLSEPEIETMDKDLQILKMGRHSLAKEAKRVEEVLRKNNNFKKFISAMKIYVQSEDGTRISVNEHTIVNFEDNMEYIITKRNMLHDQIVDLDNQIGKLEDKVQDKKSLFYVKTKIEEFDKTISKINIDYISTGRIIEQLKKRRSDLKAMITNYVRLDNDIVGRLHFLISTYARELGIDERYVSPSKDYIFTSDLKSLSGTIFHKIVFSFKLAYIHIIFEYTGIRLPIILDSPSGREIKADEVTDMIKLLVREYGDHQIIIASIHEYDLINPKVITLTDKLLGF